ncbi:MAG: hypothetical protein CVV13_13960, partial [Gammaproteobacteria bacterium HGW-Gammaproteobacteria-3]
MARFCSEKTFIITHPELTVHAPLKLKKRQLKLAVTIAILLPSLTHPAFADVDESIENLLKFGQSDARYGRITFDLNYRYEHADTENTA